MPDIFIDLDRTGSWFVFYTPYNALFVSELKARVPGPNRRWVPEERAWCVSRRYWDTAQDLLRKHYPEGDFQMGPAATAASVVLGPGDAEAEANVKDYAVLGVRPDAPDCVVHAAYLALEASWSSVEAPILVNAGFYSLDDTRRAYMRVCASRRIPSEPPPDMASLIAMRVNDAS
jgi:hypothetical protein